jgi:hypothetical protein
LRTVSGAVNYIPPDYIWWLTSGKAQISRQNLPLPKIIKELRDLPMAASYHLHLMKRWEN